MPYYRIGIVLVFVEEFFRTRESNLVDVFVYLVGCHAHAVVGNSYRTGLFIDCDIDFQIACFTLELSYRGQSFHFLASVHGIGNHLAQKYFMVGIQEFFYDGENILGSNPYVSLFHDILSLFIVRHKQAKYVPFFMLARTIEGKGKNQNKHPAYRLITT